MFLIIILLLACTLFVIDIIHMVAKSTPLNGIHHQKKNQAPISLTRNSNSMTRSNRPRIPWPIVKKQSSVSSNGIKFHPIIQDKPIKHVPQHVRFYEPIQHLNFVDFAYIIKKDTTEFVSAKLVCQTACKTLEGEPTKMKKYFVSVVSIEKYPKRQSYHSHQFILWILIDEKDFIELLRQLGYGEIIQQEKTDNHMLFQRLHLGQGNT